MSKAHRGKGIRDQFAHGRGECPVCKRNNVKILYEQEAGEQKFKICKTCRAAIKNGKKSLPVTVTAKAPEAEAPAKATETVSSQAAETKAAETKAPVAEEKAAEEQAPAAEEKTEEKEAAAE